ncbi:general amidase [Fomitopsis serialis]|uniref:general amidase n=1 Tax=Fomitopsis serialis TaxID=139415 RepID=UPI002007DCD0|nr:general amidase [Neoantrodia serialis]KAH9935666.1 general amidase [Neoantrodia serialis]
MSKVESLAVEKRQRLADAIPKEWVPSSTPAPHRLDVTGLPRESGILSDREIEITEVTDVDTLLRRLATAEWSAVEVTTAFYKRAVIAHQAVNCLTEVFVEKALARAAALDQFLKTNGKVVGPLHGLPISLKDMFNVKGIETTLGYASWVGRYAQEDAVIVEALVECGAIPYVKTNVPQSVMWTETHNLLFGRTVNPYNRSLTCGGSSGGEGALIALKGSVLGVGTDLGGSIRIPAVYNGIYGLKPSYHRLPIHGCVGPLEGQECVRAAAGPLSSSLSGLKTFMKAVLSTQPWFKDPSVVPMEWNEKLYALERHGRGEQLCFAIMWDDGKVKPHPPLQRALRMAKEALTAAGHTVTDWEPLNHYEFARLANTIWRAGSRRDIQSHVAEHGEPLLSGMGTDEDTSPGFFTGDGAKDVHAYELWQLQNKLFNMRKAYLEHWQKTASQTGTGRPVDAIICPASASVAAPHGQNQYTNYTTVWNTLDYAATVFPVTKVDARVDVKSPPHSFHSSIDKIYHGMYDPQVFNGMPVGLQLVGRPLEEEAVLAMTEIVIQALGKIGKARL